jgi:ethanolamine utilization protein EutM
MSGQSLGMIETWGYVAAVQALDAGMKAANVVSKGCTVTPSALVTIMFIGDVSAVKTAVSAGVAAARKVGEVRAHHVIARPDAQLGHQAGPARWGKTQTDPLGATGPQTEKSGMSTGLDSRGKAAGDQDLKEGRERQPKAALSGKRGKRSGKKQASAPVKTAGRKQKKKPAPGDKISGA